METSQSRLLQFEATKRSVMKHWPLMLVLPALWTMIVYLLIYSLNENEGFFVYTLDDPYIHMGMAKNFALHGIWGITQYQFSSSSSSPFWTFMLAILFAIFGVHAYMPFILNLISASALVGLVYWILQQYCLPRLYTFFILFGTICLTPLPALIFSGQEHILHTLLTILFVYLAARTLSQQHSLTSSLDRKVLLILALLLPTVRYESLFLVFPVAVLFFICKYRLYAIALGIAALLPISGYGLIAIMQGWSWLPNSVLLKGNTPRLTTLAGIVDFLTAPFYRQLGAPHILMLTLTAILLYVLRFRSGRGWRESGQLMLSLYVLITLAHMEFAQIGWFFRYEAYLVALGFVTVAMTLLDYVKSLQGHSLRQLIPPYKLPLYTTYILILAFLMTLLIYRSYLSFLTTPEAMNERYLGHIQATRFVREFYNNDVIVINDIGALSFYTDAAILDVIGLGSYEPVIFRQKPGGESKEDYAQWAKSKSAKIGIFQVDWDTVQARLPGEWVEVEEWELPRDAVVGYKTIGFYAVDPSQAGALRANLQQFRATLPDSIKVTVK